MTNINPIQDSYSKIYRKTIDKLICFIAHWELTYKCNLKCRHCYAVGDKKREEFSYEKAKSIIDELKEMGCLFLTLSGGEILMRDDFFDIASYARKAGFALKLMTNFTLIDEPLSERIAALCPLSVETSIYASSGDLHDAITSVRGSFDKMMNAAMLLKKRNLKVVLKFLIMKDNVKEFGAVKKRAEDLGAKFLFDFYVVASYDGSRQPLRHRLDADEVKDFFTINKSPLNRNELGLDALICVAGFNNIFITPYLDVYPCIGLNTKLGNLYEESLRSIWAHSKELNLIRRMKPSDLKECRGCGLVQFCNRCPGMALVEDGDVLGPSTFDCSVAKAVSEILK